MTTKTIGPTFASELAAAGLLSLPFSWMPDGTITFGSSLTAPQIAAIEAAYAAHNPASVSLPLQAEIAMAAGLTVALSGSLTLAATVFPTDPTTQIKLAAVATTINTTGGFPGGATAYPMKDASGEWHSFTVAQYKAVGAAIAAYAASLDLIIDGNPLSATGLPASAVALTV